jgi:two-component system response regulator AtoC
VIERIVVLENVETILPEHLPAVLTGGRATPSSTPSRFVLPEEGISLEETERDLIQQALERTGHNQTQAAKLLKISYDSLRYQIKKFGLM